jgi:membrane associated rhomboid family serine protease
MIPLRDDVPSRTFPFVNYAIIGLNLLVFFGELGMGAGLERFFYRAAVVPVIFAGRDHVFEIRDLVASVLDHELRARVLLSMFMHGGWAHLLGNMLYLWIFGDNVEDRCGHFKYLIFYLLCGYAATWAHIWAEPASRVPSIGASGAIAGVLGAYMTLYPRARVVALVPIFIFIEIMQLPAIFFLGFWFLQQFVLGLVDLSGPRGAGGGVAWWAHIGGFLAGIVLIRLLQSRKRRPAARDTWWEDRYADRRVRGW